MLVRLGPGKRATEPPPGFRFDPAHKLDRAIYKVHASGADRQDRPDRQDRQDRRDRQDRQDGQDLTLAQAAHFECFIKASLVVDAQRPPLNADHFVQAYNEQYPGVALQSSLWLSVCLSKVLCQLCAQPDDQRAELCRQCCGVGSSTCVAGPRIDVYVHGFIDVGRVVDNMALSFDGKLSIIFANIPVAHAYAAQCLRSRPATRACRYACISATRALPIRVGPLD